MKYATVKLGSATVPWPAMAGALAIMPLLTVMGLHQVAQQKAQGISSSVMDIAAKGQFVSPTLGRPSPEAEALALTFNSECTQPFGPSPMINRAPPKAAPPRDPPPGPTDVTKTPAPTTQPPGPAKPPTLTLTSIMDAQGQPCAVINGKIRRVGDTVGKGFKVVSINGTLGQVVIANGKVRSMLQIKRASDGE